MFKNIIIILLFSFSISNNAILILYPDANLSNTEKLNISDVDAIYLLFQEGFRSDSDTQVINPKEDYFIDHNEKVAVCGDWFINSRVEGAFLSANQLFKEGLVDSPPLYQICLGIPWGSPATTAAMKVMSDMIPEGANWAGFGIGRHQMPMVAQSVILGGNVRVGLEDNLYLEKGVFASNAQLVEKSARIIDDLGAKILSPEDARTKLNLKKHF